MAQAEATNRYGQATRRSRARAIADECLARLSNGENVDVLRILAANRELPELAGELRKVALVRAAAWQDDAGSTNDSATHELAPESGSSSLAVGHAGDGTHQAAESLALDGYTVIERIGGGSQGTVYAAEETATHRRVAVKVLGADRCSSENARQWFDREIEITARLRHPNIAQVYCAGHSLDGRPYYVMEHCPGVAINQYVINTRPSLDETLRLFSLVCDAVHYAHQRGIIHRDLKPSNILVCDDSIARARVNGGGAATSHSPGAGLPLPGGSAPKVLDFGLAKALDSSSRPEVVSRDGFIGTVPYMSPEQALEQTDAIDIRTDVYALGVVLYELVTGTLPYPATGPLAEVIRHIVHAVPLRARDAWTTRRGVRGGGVDGRRCPFGADVEAILSKALAKDRNLRYQSAGELATDIRRLLRREPIEARRTHLGYRAAKWTQRHAGRLVVGVVVVAILASTVAAWSRAVHAERQRNRVAAEASERERRDAWVDRLREAAMRPTVAEVPSPELRDAVENVWGLVADGRANPLELEALAAATVRFWTAERRVIVSPTADVPATHNVCLRVSRAWIPPGFLIDLVGFQTALSFSPDSPEWERRLYVPVSTHEWGRHTYANRARVRFLRQERGEARELAQARIPVGPFEFLVARRYPDEYPAMIHDPTYQDAVDRSFTVQRVAFVTVASPRRPDGKADALRVEFTIPAAAIDAAFDVELSLPDSELYLRTPLAIQAQPGSAVPTTRAINNVGIEVVDGAWRCWVETSAHLVAAQTDPQRLIGRSLTVTLSPSRYIARYGLTSDVFLAVRGQAEARVADDRDPTHRAAAAAVYPVLDQTCSRDDALARLRESRAVSEESWPAVVSLVESATEGQSLAIQAVMAAYEAGRPRAAYERALARARTSVELEPTNYLTHQALGIALYRLDQFREAIQALDVAHEVIGRPMPLPLLFTAMARQRLGDAVKARSLLHDYHELRASDPSAGQAGERVLREAIALIDGS